MRVSEEHLRPSLVQASLASWVETVDRKVLRLPWFTLPVVPTRWEARVVIRVGEQPAGPDLTVSGPRGRREACDYCRRDRRVADSACHGGEIVVAESLGQLHRLKN